VTIAAEHAVPGRTGLDVVETYLESVFRRGRQPMEPIGFSPDWADQPSRHTTHLSASRSPLPPGPVDSDVPPAELLLPRPGTGQRDDWTLAELAAVLRAAYGTVNRRLRVSWNQDSHVRQVYSEAIWGRGAASGGGMYPLEVYLVVADDRLGVLPGVYHYSTAHHELERLALRPAAVPGGDDPAPAYLAVTARFWKNSFKYNSFCYHVVTQDVGALVEVVRLLAASAGLSVRPQLLFDDRSHNRSLGLREDEESVLALVPLTSGSAPRTVGATGSPRTDVAERSRRVLTFPTVTEVHRAVLDAGLVAPVAEPVPRTREPVPGPRLELPPPELAGRHARMEDVVRERRSSFGSFAAGAGIDLAQLSGILAAGAAATEWDADVDAVGRGNPTLHVLVNNMPDLASGAYSYLPGTHELAVVQQRRLAEELQRAYYLSNYNLQEASAVIAVAADWAAARDAHGARAYRSVNFGVAAVAQAVNVAATASDVASGIVLGFDNLTIDELLGFSAPHRRTFLFVILGEEATRPAAYTYELR
jgi:SagB-type dehydrogenase family enzyme